MEIGGQCVMMDSVRQKPQWRVGSWDSLIIAAMEMLATHSMLGIYHNNKYMLIIALCDAAVFRVLTGSSHWLHACCVYTR